MQYKQELRVTGRCYTCVTDLIEGNAITRFVYAETWGNYEDNPAIAEVKVNPGGSIAYEQHYNWRGNN